MPMEKNEVYGYWEVFTGKPSENDLYKYKVRQADGRVVYKIDPFAIAFEKRPDNAAVIHHVPEKNGRMVYGTGERSVLISFSVP